MKGKGKGKDISDNKECPLKFLDFSPLDITKHCPVYSSIVPKVGGTTPEQEEEEEEHGNMGVVDIDTLQFELEALLISVVKRREELEEETQILTAWQEKKTATEKSESEVSGKRSNTSEDKPAKKFKDSEGNAQPSSSVGRPKTKNSQTNKTQECDFEDSSSSETAKPQKNDVPNRFWASVEPYFAEITPDHVKFLEDWIKSHEGDEEYFQVPNFGNHYSDEWSSKETLEEQTEGLKAIEKPKESDSSRSSFVGSPDPEEGLQKAESECDGGDGGVSDGGVSDGAGGVSDGPGGGSDADGPGGVSDATSGISEGAGCSSSSSSTCDCDCDNTPSEIGPLAQRLVSCLIEEEIMPSLEDTIETSSEASDIPEYKMAPEAKENFIHSLNVCNTLALEEKIRLELEEAGILSPAESTETEEETEDESEGGVLSELRDVQEALKIIIDYNLVQKQKLLQLAKEEIARQEIRKKLQQLDSQILEFQRKKHNKKSPITKKDKEQILKIIKERETLIEQLESTGNFCM